MAVIAKLQRFPRFADLNLADDQKSPKNMPELQRSHAKLAPSRVIVFLAQPASGSSAQIGAGVFQRSYGRPG
jgi:hypothetical protein